jgi:1-deoxy-D-xylulose-5-phosphate reductoisomerase
VTGLAAGQGRLRSLAEQAAQFRPSRIAVPTDDAAATVSRHLAAFGVQDEYHPRIEAGPEAAAKLAGAGTDVVLNSMAGAAGLEPTLAALTAGSSLALANKESLVVGGALVKAAVQRPGQIIPVDSEHSAIAQCLRAGSGQEVASLILTASGGPFRGATLEQLRHVSPQQALKHPTWRMGPLVTCNSATLINKALELIEAHLLFDIAPERIEVVVHPQSIVHSMVRFIDGAVIAQASPPDMRLPIALALSWPERMPQIVPKLDWAAPTSWGFEPVDNTVFPAVELGREAIRRSPLHPAVLNGANEVLVEGFLAGRLPFLGITEGVGRLLDAFQSSVHPGEVPSLEEIKSADAWARQQAGRLVEGA